MRNLGGVGGLTFKLEFELYRSIRTVGRHRVEIGGMPGEDSVQASEYTGAGKDRLAELFLGRTAEIFYRPPHRPRLDGGLEAGCRSNTGGSQEVVTAAVAGTSLYEGVA